MSEIRDELFYKQKNGYDTMDTQQRVAMEDYCRGYISFLNDARTEREAVKTAIEFAEDAGFVEYTAGMELKAGDKVYHQQPHGAHGRHLGAQGAKRAVHSRALFRFKICHRCAQ